VARLVPNRSRLDAEDRLRFDAASSAALRHREDAIKAYRQLADRQPNDAGRWLDAGRAQEAGGRLPEAIDAYAKAAALDAQSAAARLRLGVLQARAGMTDEGLASIDEAIDLYRKMAKTEGEAEALLRKGVALATLGKSDDARAMFDQVLQLIPRSVWARGSASPGSRTRPAG
jgi:tetratricopeptide (TPR) repeat protein